MDAVMRIRWRHWLPRRSWRVVGLVAEADFVPRRVPKRGLVIVGSRSDPQWLVFRCPCGADRVMLNMNPARRPTWRAKTFEPPSIRPSVDTVHRGRRCHYLLTDGRIDWVGSS
jgi:hypothetical protein